MLIHIVKSGENLWSIIYSYGLYPSQKAVQKVYNFNGLWYNQYIYPGQHLLIPLDGLYYTIKPEDTLWLISKRFNSPLNKLVTYNNIQDPSKIYPGMAIKFPDGTDSIVKNPEQHTICIDPGHQMVPDLGTEPIGPGSSIQKIKVNYGTRGVYTGKPEYEINLEVSMKIRELLNAKGYNVLMTRETNNINISNMQRALMANKAKADLCVRIHSNASNISSTINGLSVMYPSPESPYSAEIYMKSYKLAELMLSSLISSTHTNSEGLVPASDLSGFNWSTIPVVLVEMGYMSNPQEDIKLSTPQYQYEIAKGIVDSIEKYMAS